MYLTRVLGEQEIKCENIFVTVCLGQKERWVLKQRKKGKRYVVPEKYLLNIYMINNFHVCFLTWRLKNGVLNGINL